MDLGVADIAGRSAAIFAAMEAVAPAIAARANERDATEEFPAEEFELLRDAGALFAPVPAAFGGMGFGTDAAAAPAAMALLRLIGRASLPVGRVFEGHVNAVRLIFRLGTQMQRRRAAKDARAGHLFGVWNTDPSVDNLRIESQRLVGAKILASGAGFVTRALVTAAGAPRPLLLVELARDARADLRGWTAQGMRASATGRVDFTGLDSDAWQSVGLPGAYLLQPDFSAGAWRVLAVQLGGLDALVGELRAGLIRRDRHADPHQLARVGAALIAQETAALFVRRAAELAEAETRDCEQVVAYVGLARVAVESACLDALRLVQRGLGLTALLRPAAVERIARDLATYLRQPVLDETLTEAAAWFMDHELP